MRERTDYEKILAEAEARALKLICQGKLLREMDMRLILRECLKDAINKEEHSNE